MSLRTAGILALSAVVITAVFPNSASAGERIKGSGKIGKTSRKLAAFHAVTLKVPADLSIGVGADEPVTIETDDNILPHIKTEVKDGQLIIDSSDKELQTSSKISIKMRSAKLDELNLDGASTSNLSGFNNGNLSISSKGASNINLAGSLNKLNIDMKGAGQVQAAKLSTKETTIAIKGTGSAELTVSDKLDATINGTGSVRYHGNAKVNQKILGIGSVTKI